MPTKRDRSKGFVQIPNLLLHDNRIKPREKLILCALMSYDYGIHEHVVWPSQLELSGALGIKREAIREGFDTLEGLGIIELIGRDRRKKRSYRLHVDDYLAEKRSRQSNDLAEKRSGDMDGIGSGNLAEKRSPIIPSQEYESNNTKTAPRDAETDADSKVKPSSERAMRSANESRTPKRHEGPGRNPVTSAETDGVLEAIFGPRTPPSAAAELVYDEQGVPF